MKRFATCTVASILATATWATDFVWTGNTQYAEDWFDPGNWEVNGSPTDTYPQAGDTATFNKDATLNVNGEITVGTLILNANLTHRRDKWLTIGGVSGTGKLILANRGRLRNNGAEVDFTCDIVITNSDDTACNHSAMQWIQANGAAFTISGKLLGDGNVFLTMGGYNSVKLAGDNSGFTGTIHLDSNVANRVKIAAETGSPANGRYIIHGNTSDNGGLMEGSAGGTFKFGSIYTEARTTGNYPFRFKNLTSTAILEIGSLNREDDRISIRMGEGNTSTGQAKIRKVGTGTLELWHTGHIRGTEIADGTLLVTSTDALNGRTDGTTSLNGTCQITFTGGTLKYGTDEWTDPSNPADITTDWSSQVTESTGAIAVDTNGKDITWAYDGLQSKNPDAKGFTKKGDGTLTLSGSWHDNSRKFFSQGIYTNRIEGGTLAIRNCKYTAAEDFKAKVLGNGTLKICSSEVDGGYRLRGNGAFSEFEGTLEWANEMSEANKAVGFMCNNANIDMANVRFRVTGNPAEPTMIMKGETGSSTRTVTVGAFDHLYPNAQLHMGGSWNLNINGTAGDSNLNGTFINNPVTITKSGAGKLTIGPGFSAPNGSQVNVNEGVFALNAGVTYAQYSSILTIASGVALAGEGVFGAVNLSVNDVVVPDAATFTDKTATYPILTATSFSGTSANVTTLLNTLNANEKSGSWRVRAVPTGNGAYTLTIAYFKSGFMIIFK